MYSLSISSSSSSSTIIVRPLSCITTMGGCAHRSGRIMELRLECGDGIRVDAGFRKRVPLRYCSDKKRMFILSIRGMQTSIFWAGPQTGYREGCHRKGIQCKNTLECMAGLTFPLICVAAAGLLVVIQCIVWVRQHQFTRICCCFSYHKYIKSTSS